MASKTCSRIFMLLSLLLTSTMAFSAEIHGRSSTQLLWFNDDFSESRQVDLSQYLRISVTGIDAAGKASIHGYGRGAQDLNNGNGSEARLYYLYGEYRDLFDKLDLRLGRQFVNLSAGSSLIDGGQLDIKNVGPVGFTILGGRDVIFDLDNEKGENGDMAVGASAYLMGFRKFDAEVSWLRKTDSWDISRDTLGATGKAYLLNSLQLYGNTRYDLVSEEFTEGLVGVKYYPTADLILTGEWYQSYPTFDATSIYSVFAVNRYQEWVGRADYTINEKVSVNGSFTRQSFGDDTNANVYEVGCRLRPVEKLGISLAYDRREEIIGGDSTGVELNGGSFDITYDAKDNLQIAGGLTYDVYDRAVNDGIGDETASKYWIGGKYKFTKNMIASIRVEDNVNERHEEDVQGRFVFDYTF